MKSLILFFSISSFVFGYGNNFSCAYGKQGACLDYGDKVCSSFSKCVSSDAICFNSYTCNYKGFVCKSKLDDIADEYDSLVSKYNSLVSDYSNLESDYDDMSYKYRRIKNCIESADTIDDAKYCY